MTLLSRPSQRIRKGVYQVLTSATFQSQPQSQQQHQLQLRKFALSAQQPSRDHWLAKGHMGWELPTGEG